MNVDSPASARRSLSGGEVLERPCSTSPRTSMQRRGVVDAQRDRADRAQVVGDVLADLAVAAGGAALEHAVPYVSEMARPSIFGSHTNSNVGSSMPSRAKCERIRATQARSSSSERALAEREHRLAVADLLEVLDRRGADALRGRVGGDELGVLGLELAQLVEQRVVVVVVDARGRRGRSSGGCAGRAPRGARRPGPPPTSSPRPSLHLAGGRAQQAREVVHGAARPCRRGRSGRSAPGSPRSGRRRRRRSRCRPRGGSRARRRRCGTGGGRRRPPPRARASRGRCACPAG